MERPESGLRGHGLLEQHGAGGSAVPAPEEPNALGLRLQAMTRAPSFKKIPKWLPM